MTRFFTCIFAFCLSLSLYANDKCTLRVNLPQNRVRGAETAELSLSINTEKGEVTIGSIILKADKGSMLTGEFTTDITGAFDASASWPEDPHVAFSFFLEPGTVNATAVGEHDFQVTGTPLNDALAQYKKEVENLPKSSGEENGADSIMEAYMKKYADTPLFGYLFQNSFYVQFSSFRDTKAKVEHLYSLGSEKQKRIKSVLNTYRRICQNKIENGMQFLDAEIPNATVEGNKTVRLSDYIGHGKWVFIDFWASWCVGCRQAIPRVKKAYEAMKDKNIEFISIAVWDKRRAALKAIAEENMPWLQLIDEKGVCGETYMFNAIPRLMLFSPDGKLVDKDVRSSNVMNILDKHLN